ncbi:hypothetical protein BC936DRAFT_137856 [Jimgerdemannia flammicorona]|uniref:Uncharacterized protein n=1 Tax=Jimgerdemannia flammicorona TaxID=994334 RepID=A0A433CWJ1_9FUNG|nr:hypothetical protein BC936DRAFT_137856 [Jimgerdemannia flammicorona]
MANKVVPRAPLSTDQLDVQSDGRIVMRRSPPRWPFLSDDMSEPRLEALKYLEFRCYQELRGINDFFKNVPASRWSLKSYINDLLKQPDHDLSFDQAIAIFIEDLEQLCHIKKIPVSVRSVCGDYIKWLKTLTGKAAVQSSRNLFNASMELKGKILMNSVVKESVHVTAQTSGFQNLLKPREQLKEYLEKDETGSKGLSPKKDTLIEGDDSEDEDSEAISDYESIPKPQIEIAEDRTRGEQWASEEVVGELSNGESLENVWKRLMTELAKRDITIQTISSRIIDLSNWNPIEWMRVFSVFDNGKLLREHRKYLDKDKISENVRTTLRDAKMSSLNELRVCQRLFEASGGSDGELAAQIVAFFHKIFRREVNVLNNTQRERDYIINILGPLFSDLLQEFDSGRFKLYWASRVEKEVRAVTSRKRRYVNAEYTQLSQESRKVDMLVELRDFSTELLFLEIGNTEMHFNDTKERVDKSALSIQLKDGIDQLCYGLHFKKADLERIFTIGIQVSGIQWTIFSMRYDVSTKFYFMVEMATLTLPTTLSGMEDLLPSFIESMLALRHTLLYLNKIIRVIARQRQSTPSPPSSPLGDTIATPKSRKLKGDSRMFDFMDDLYDKP